jgi:hypothetical protein
MSKENTTSQHHYNKDKDAFLKSLANLGRMLGYDEHRAVVDIADYAVICQKAFHLEHKDTMRLLWHMFGIGQ